MVGRQVEVEAISDPARVHAICEEYRAAASLDREHDADDVNAGRRVTCPLLALWSEQGGLNSWYEEVGGPLAIWRTLADSVRGEPVAGDHFFPEEHPGDLVARLRAFL
ncbi:hypothetical protein [uncultured Sphingomonas sp.]|uniref:alpha/beta fold hydrolase n=1 Tax=uncultured Sphingomonas sp. TaxID=158754 RepID=UPI002624A7A7|nr:hypothetical protein [uncultured Sphingomonas sp.]